LVSTYKDQKKIVDYILDPQQFEILILDQFGNYLIQSILDMSSQHPENSKQVQKLYDISRVSIYKQLEGKIYEFSTHKFASNVVEKCLLEGTSEQVQTIMSEILKTEEVVSLLINDKFGNYVIQKSIDVLQKYEQTQGLRKLLIDKILDLQKSE
jgi:hypothetical protein